TGAWQGRPKTGCGALYRKVPPARQTHGAVKPMAQVGARSRIAVELAFLDHALVRLGVALDAILLIVAFRRQELRDPVDGIRLGPPIWSGCVTDVFADLEPVMIAHVALQVTRGTRPDAYTRRAPLSTASMRNPTTEMRRKGTICAILLRLPVPTQGPMTN